MKFELKENQVPRGYRLIMYPEGLPSTGYLLTRQHLYAIYVELRDMFQDGPPEEEDEEPLGLSIGE